MGAVGVEMSVGLGLVFGDRIALIETLVAATRACLGRAGLLILPRAILTNAAVDGVGAGRDDGPVVVGEGVRCTGDGREELVGRVAVPAGGQAHFLEMLSPGSHGTDAGVSVGLVTGGAVHAPEIHAVARQGILHGVFADQVVRVAEDVTRVVAGPFTDGVCFED